MGQQEEKDMMTLSHLRFIVVAGIVAGAAVSPAVAQESLRVLFEITVDGSVVARPELRRASNCSSVPPMTSGRPRLFSPCP